MLKAMLQRLLPCLLLIPAIAQGQSSVWKISKGAQTLYIGGTCHILRLDDYPLPAEFDLAYAAADKLVLEVDYRIRPSK